MSYLEKRKTIILLSAFAIMLINQISLAKWIPVDEYKSEKTSAKIDVISKNKNRKAYCSNDFSEIQKIILNITTSGVEAIDITGVETLNGTGNKVTYQMLDIPGVTASSPEIGKPNVPVKVFMHEVPFGSVFDVNVESVEKKLIKNINVYPKQKEVPESSNERSEFSKDQNTYSSSQLYPENFLLKSETITMRNHQFIRLEVALAKCRPADKELQLVSSMKIVIELKNNSKKSMNFNESRSFNQLFSSENSTVDLIQNRTGSVPEKYMILMDDQFSGNSTLNEFIEWKNRKGYDVNVVKTSQIDNSGAPDSSQIQRFMLSIPDSLYPTYLLIIGDETAENGVDGWFRYSDYSAFMNSSENYFGFTDLYYTIRNTSKGFPVPDLFYGRIPARNNNELTLMLQKAINMDRTPPRNNMFNKILVAGMLQDDTTYLSPRMYLLPDNIADHLFCETADAIASYFEIDPKNVGYTCTRSFVKDSTVDSNCLWSPRSILWNYTDKIGSRIYDHFLDGTIATARISSQISNGISAVFHRDHGSYTDWVNPYFSVTEINNLQNSESTPLIYSINCLTGGYHKTNNFTRSFLFHENGGAYAVIAAVDISYSWANDWMSHGLLMGLFDDYRNMINTSTIGNQGVDWSKTLPAPLEENTIGLIEGSAKKLGQNLHFGKTYLLQNFNAYQLITFEIFHVFGDPEGDIVINTPQTQMISHPYSISTGSQTIAVATNGNKLQVCLYSEDLGIHLVAYSENDTAFFNINPSLAGEINVTVTGFGKRPYEGIINVNSSTNNQLFGFEDPSLWSFSIGNGVLTSNTTQKTEGFSSIVLGGNNYREITSPAINTSEINNISSTIALDLFIGATQPNPYWIGEIALFISCPSAGIYHLSIGNTQLSGLSQNVFNTINFNLPSNVLSVLAGNYSDFAFSVVLNTNTASGPYLLDNMRFIH